MRTSEEVDSIYTEIKLKKMISEFPLWWHNIKLGSKVITPGKYSAVLLNWIMENFPKDFSGKSVLDVGAWDGGFSFESERRNAKEIVAIDVFQGRKNLGQKPFNLCKEILDSKVNYQELDVINVEKLNKSFDIILFLGVYYHLINPFLALEKLYSVCNEVVVLEGEILQSTRSICYFLESGEIGGDTTNVFLFSPTFLENFATKIGFKKIEFKGYLSDQGPIITSDKKIIDNGKNKDPPLRRNRGFFYLWV